MVVQICLDEGLYTVICFDLKDFFDEEYNTCLRNSFEQKRTRYCKNFRQQRFHFESYQDLSAASLRDQFLDQTQFNWNYSYVYVDEELEKVKQDYTKIVLEKENEWFLEYFQSLFSHNQGNWKAPSRKQIQDYAKEVKKPSTASLLDYYNIDYPVTRAGVYLLNKYVRDVLSE